LHFVHLIFLYVRSFLIFYSEHPGNLSSHLVDVVASFDHDLRFLIMQGILSRSFFPLEHFLFRY